MKRKILGLLMIIMSLVIIGGIIYILFLSGIDLGGIFGRKDQTSEEKKEEVPVIDTTIKEKNPVEITPLIEENKRIRVEVEGSNINKEALASIAASFSERFGSYSNQSNFSNINDLRIFMTKNMSSWANKFIEEQGAKAQASDIYYGITTKAISEEIEDFDESAGKAVILVKTRRREALGATDNVSKTFNQDILITFIKEKEAWKVDSAYWQD